MKLPRNKKEFAISFGVELCVAQPIARAVMFAIHSKLNKVNA